MIDRDAEIRQMHEAGCAYAEIGRKHGISSSRARQIVLNHQTKATRQHPSPNWTLGINRKLANALIAEGYTSKEQVKVALASGKIGLREDQRTGKVPGIGPHSITQLTLWVGTKTELE